MENRVFLRCYRLSPDQKGRPVVLHRTPTSVLYRAEDIESGRTVGLELVASAIFNPRLSQELETEAGEARQINHLNIPRLYDFGFDCGEIVYISEYCEGKTATSWVRTHGPLTTAEVLRVAVQVASAIEAMAFHRIYHHALNPDNIVFVGGEDMGAEGPSIKIAHWLGIAPLFAESGNPRLDNAALYASPEQLYTSVVDLRSEIYSLGCTMWFLLTGAAPIAVETGRGINETSSMAKKPRSIPKDLRHLLYQMLRLEPDERPQDPVALTTSLQACLEQVEARTTHKRGLDLPVFSNARRLRLKPRDLFSARSAAIALAFIILMLAGAAAFPQYFSVHNVWPLQTKAGAGKGALPNDVAANSRAHDEAPLKGAEPVVEVTHDQFEPAIAQRTGVGSDLLPPGEGPADAIGESEVAGSSPDIPLQQPKTQDEISENAASVEITGGETHVAAANSPPRSDEGSTAKPELEKPARSDEGPDSTRPKKISHSPTNVVSHAKRNPKSKSLAKQSSRANTHTRQVTVRRAKAIPELHYGSSAAEMVGMTEEGHWILSIQSSGRRVVVPPPPGFAGP